MKSQIDIARELQGIVDAYDCRSELFTSDADCAANLADRARKAIAALQPVADERELGDPIVWAVRRGFVQRENGYALANGWYIPHQNLKALHAHFERLYSDIDKYRASLPPQAVEPILDHITFDERSAIASTLTDDLYDSKDWRDGGIVERIEWLRGMYEDKKVEIAELFAMLEAAEEDRKLLDSGCIMTYECDEFGMEYMCERRVLDLRAAIRAAMEKEQQS